MIPLCPRGTSIWLTIARIGNNGFSDFGTNNCISHFVLSFIYKAVVVDIYLIGTHPIQYSHNHSIQHHIPIYCSCMGLYLLTYINAYIICKDPSSDDGVNIGQYVLCGVYMNTCHTGVPCYWPSDIESRTPGNTNKSYLILTAGDNGRIATAGHGSSYQRLLRPDSGLDLSTHFALLLCRLPV